MSCSELQNKSSCWNINNSSVDCAQHDSSQPTVTAPFLNTFLKSNYNQYSSVKAIYLRYCFVIW